MDPLQRQYAALWENQGLRKILDELDTDLLARLATHQLDGSPECKDAVYSLLMEYQTMLALKETIREYATQAAKTLANSRDER